MIQIPSTAVELETILGYLSASILEWAALFLLSQELIRTEDGREFIIPRLLNRMKTSFYSFSHHILSSVKYYFLLLVGYDSGRTITEDRCNSLRINYWAPILISILYDFWEHLEQSKRGKITQLISHTLGQENLKLLPCISRGRLK